MPEGNKVVRINARSTELGEGLIIHRALPSKQQRTIGAWCFLDHAGPVQFAEGQGMRVGPHPHIGLQTFTWMLEGEVLHRDSLGYEQMIRPKQVNLMTAGRGIAHSENSNEAQTALHALQLWIALPRELQTIQPTFTHYPELPLHEENGCSTHVLVGQWQGLTSPVEVHSPLLAVDWQSAQAREVSWSVRNDFEYGIFVVQGAVTLEGERYEANELAYLPRGLDCIQLSAADNTHVLILGGEPMAEPLLIWWNFVGYERDQLRQAFNDWESGNTQRFGEVKNESLAPLAMPAWPWAERE